MRTAFVVVGAALLVAGGCLLAFAPFYTSTGFYTAELKYIQTSYNSTSPNPSLVASTYASYADTGELIALVGAVIAPIGAGTLAYGIAAGRSGGKEKQDASLVEPVQA